MKNPILVWLLSFGLALSAHSQVPPLAFNYSAVSRNATGQPIASSAIGIQLSILKGSATGPIQYQENHSVITDTFGLFNLVIGGGSIQNGSMASINWSNDNYYLQVGMDTAAGNNFITMGITQLLSVPYALHAKTADSIVSSSGNTTGGCFSHHIGEQFGGGIIYYLWKDDQNIEHGYIIDLVNLSTSQIWSNVDSIDCPCNYYDGNSNSDSIVAQPNHMNSAASLCLNSTNGGYNDWYLPAAGELKFLGPVQGFVNKALSAITGADQIWTPTSSFYWTSTQGTGSFTGQGALVWWGDPQQRQGGSDGGLVPPSNLAVTVGYVRAMRQF